MLICTFPLCRCSKYAALAAAAASTDAAAAAAAVPEASGLIEVDDIMALGTKVVFRIDDP